MEGRFFTAALTLPTQFHGDLLATVEATYVDGASAGPAGWTPSAADVTSPRPSRRPPAPPRTYATCTWSTTGAGRPPRSSPPWS
ncbi:hypothetical protein [Streptomyces sp. NPDC006739]|uniref:hypothetical protein n=1 Tax=Streptomyces sp. NPDC006739 TaxID=3364763 RepID=UPI003685BE4D